MKLINEVQLFKKMPEILDEVSDHHERFIVAHGEGKNAVLLSVEDYNQLLQGTFEAHSMK